MHGVGVAAYARGSHEPPPPPPPPARWERSHAYTLLRGGEDEHAYTAPFHTPCSSWQHPRRTCCVHMAGHACHLEAVPTLRA